MQQEQQALAQEQHNRNNGTQQRVNRFKASRR
jgi:hypothetical protein